MHNEESKNEIVIALAGNPNSGKTTVFNGLTGAHQHVGNWPGVTVEHKEGIVKKGDVTFHVIDLPGTYSLSAYSHEEVVTRNFLLNNHVDVVINVLDASNLERNLYLTTQLLELGIGMVIALNMVDMAESNGYKIDIKKFSNFLGVPVVPTVGHRGEGLDEILEEARIVAQKPSHDLPRTAKQNSEIESEVAKLESHLNLKMSLNVPIKWMLIKALEGDTEARRRLSMSAEKGTDVLAEVDKTRRHLEQHFGDDLEAVIADARYGFAGGLMREVVTRTQVVNRIDLTEKIDKVLLNRVLGIPIFLLMMWITFELTFDVGGIFQHILSKGVAGLSIWLTSVLPHGPISSLIVDGALAGVGGVIVFLPSIAVMFTVISFLEDSGYMARAAFIMDRAMHKLGLHGKSFIPMLMGFGCNVPAIMATRTLDTAEDRILTILITPLMSCTARLPIYILFTGIFFSKNGAMVVFSLYALGIILAVASGKLFRKVLFPKAVSPFVMELPPYRLPTFKGTVIHVWERASSFLTKAGTIILAASIIIWAMGTFPWGVKFGSEQSIVGHLGRLMEPIVKPLGMDWKAAVALFFGLGAKEIVVSTIGVLYGFGHDHSHAASSLFAKSFTPLSAYTFMVISLIYVPCAATIAAIRRETNSWKWTIFSICYTLVLAYVLGFLIYHIGLLVGLK